MLLFSEYFSTFRECTRAICVSEEDRKLPIVIIKENGTLIYSLVFKAAEFYQNKKIIFVDLDNYTLNIKKTGH